MATYETSDESVVVVIGSGAGGGTLANELCQKGVPVVLLEPLPEKNSDSRMMAPNSATEADASTS